jgi:hypothetical protein
MRRPPCDEDFELTSAAVEWLARLPSYARPVLLSEQFPRVTNEIMNLWFDPAALEQFFNQQEFDSRPYRRGFPPAVKMEIRGLHSLARLRGFNLRGVVFPPD